MVIIIEPQIPAGTSLTSLVHGFLLTKRTECQSLRTAEYYECHLKRFLWYTHREQLPDDARLLNEGHIREFLAYVSGQTNRWGLRGNGSESSQNKATYTTVHHYYRVLKTFFSWCIKEGFLDETPMAKIKFTNPKLKIIQLYTAKKIKEIKEMLWFVTVISKIMHDFWPATIKL